MSKVYTHVDDKLVAWMVRQRMFFIATAPRSDAGHINVSPKGPIECLRILEPRRVAYLDLIGSGAETVAHVRENGKIVLMLCAFEGPPRIVRLHGRGGVVQTGEQDFDTLNSEFGFCSLAAHDGGRAIVTIDVERVSDSCGMGVPLMQYQGERSQYLAWIKESAVEGRRCVDGLRDRAQRHEYRWPTSIRSHDPASASRTSVMSEMWRKRTSGRRRCREVIASGQTGQIMPWRMAYAVASARLRARSLA